MRFFTRWLANIKVAIFLLFCIILCSIIGSVVEQTDQQTTSTLIKTLKQPSGLNFDFSNIFNNFGFFILNFLLGLSLFTCTLTQQFPSFDFCRGLSFLKNFSEINSFDVSFRVPRKWFPFLLSQLEQKNYVIFQKSNSVYASKGLAGRLGPVFVHLSLLLILFGSLISAFQGFLAQEFIPKGEITYLQNFPSEHLLDNLPALPVRINDFWVSHINGLIHQFYSNLSSLDLSGKEMSQFTLSVNHPFFIDDVVWYQTDWDIIGLKYKIDNLLYQVPVTSISTSQKKLWISWIPLSLDGLSIFFETMRGNFLLQNINIETPFFVELNETILDKNQINLSIIDLLACTGLQVKRDPGQFFLTLGFGTLIFSTFVSYLSYSRLWISTKCETIQITGLTNRSKLSFDYDLLNLFTKNNKNF